MVRELASVLVEHVKNTVGSKLNLISISRVAALGTAGCDVNGDDGNGDEDDYATGRCVGGNAVGVDEDAGTLLRFNVSNSDSSLMGSLRKRFPLCTLSETTSEITGTSEIQMFSPNYASKLSVATAIATQNIVSLRVLLKVLSVALILVFGIELFFNY
jgi:hypothetical protein